MLNSEKTSETGEIRDKVNFDNKGMHSFSDVFLFGNTAANGERYLNVDRILQVHFNKKGEGTKSYMNRERIIGKRRERERERGRRRKDRHHGERWAVFTDLIQNPTKESLAVDPDYH